MKRLVFVIIFVLNSLISFGGKLDSLSGQELSDALSKIARSYLDSTIDVYLKGSQSQKLDAAFPLWCAFNQKIWWKVDATTPLSKIDSAEIRSFIKTEIKKENQLEKKIDFLLLTKPYNWLEEKVAIGSIDTNRFNTTQMAQYYNLLGFGNSDNDKSSPEKIVFNYKKAIHYSKNKKALGRIFSDASHYLGSFYFSKGNMKDALLHFENRINAASKFDLGKLNYLQGNGLYQRGYQYSIKVLINIGMCYGKLGNIVEEINYYKKALAQLKLARRPLTNMKFWIQSLMVNSYFDLGNDIRAKKLMSEYLTDLNKDSTIYGRGAFIYLFRELNYYDIEKSRDVLDSLFFTKSLNYKLFEPDSVANKPVYSTYIDRARLISVRAISTGLGRKKLELNKVVSDVERLIDLHIGKVDESNSKNLALKSLQCIELAWKIGLQNERDASNSQKRLTEFFSNEDSLHYFSYYSKLTTYILKLNGRHNEEIELLQLLMPRYKNGHYIIELQKLYFQLSEAYQATGKHVKSLAYYKRSDSLKQQTQQLNQQAQLAMFDKKLETTKTNVEKKLLEKENQSLIARRNGLVVLVVLASLVIILIGLLFYINRKRNKLAANQKQLELELLQKDVNIKTNQLENTTLQLLKSNSSFAKLYDEMSVLTTDLNSSNKKKAKGVLLEHKEQLENEIWEQFNLEFQKNNATFYQSLKEQIPTITESELRIASLHLSGLSNKEISAITGQQITSVYTLKNRLRNKLSAQNDAELAEKLKKY